MPFIEGRFKKCTFTIKGSVSATALTVYCITVFTHSMKPSSSPKPLQYTLQSVSPQSH